MNLKISLLLVATIVEPPFAGMNKKTGRTFARVTVAGQLGDNFEKLSISLPDNFDFQKLKVNETWIWPLARMEGDQDRRVYYRLRNDAEGLRLLQRVPHDWTPSADEAA